MPRSKEKNNSLPRKLKQIDELSFRPPPRNGRVYELRGALFTSQIQASMWISWHFVLAVLWLFSNYARIKGVINLDVDPLYLFFPFVLTPASSCMATITYHVRWAIAAPPPTWEYYHIHSIYTYGCGRDGCAFPPTSEESADQITHTHTFSKAQSRFLSHIKE